MTVRRAESATGGPGVDAVRRRRGCERDCRVCGLPRTPESRVASHPGRLASPSGPGDGTPMGFKFALVSTDGDMFDSFETNEGNWQTSRRTRPFRDLQCCPGKDCRCPSTRPTWRAIEQSRDARGDANALRVSCRSGLRTLRGVRRRAAVRDAGGRTGLGSLLRRRSRDH